MFNCLLPTVLQEPDGQLVGVRGTLTRSGRLRRGVVGGVGRPGRFFVFMYGWRFFFALRARDGRDDDLVNLSVESPDDRPVSSFPSATVCGYILRRKFFQRECKTVPKSPASFKTFALATA